MKLEELLYERVDVDVVPIVEVPNSVRVTTVLRNRDVWVQYCGVGDYLDGAADQGIVYRGHYETWDALLEDLEKFLGAPLPDWRNFSQRPHTAEAPTATDEDHSEIFARLVHERRLPVPSGTPFRLSSIYWRQIEKHGDWDEDRALRDQELELRNSSD